MKKQIFKLIAAIIMMGPVISLGQSPADALFDKYSGKDGFTSVYITQHMFSLFANIETDEDESGFMDLVKNLNCIKILSMEKDSLNPNPSVNFYDEMMKNFPKNKYEELMVIKKSDQNINFYIHKDGKKISELLMIVGGKEDNAMVSIQGDIDLKTISKLSKSMNIEGMENLGEMDEKENK